MKRLIPILAVALTLASCATHQPQAAAPQGSIDHVVLVWLKRPGNAADRTKLLAVCDELRAIPNVTRIDAGTPLASERPIVDDSFDVGAVMRFPNTAALRTYETHPLHVKKVTDTIKPLARKLVVYDIAH